MSNHYYPLTTASGSQTVTTIAGVLASCIISPRSGDGHLDIFDGTTELMRINLDSTVGFNFSVGLVIGTGLNFTWSGLVNGVDVSFNVTL